MEEENITTDSQEEESFDYVFDSNEKESEDANTEEDSVSEDKESEGGEEAGETASTEEDNEPEESVEEDKEQEEEEEKEPLKEEEEPLENTKEQEEEVKEQEETELSPELKELQQLVEGDDFLKNFIENYKNGGDVTAYLESQSVDYKKMSDIEILRKRTYQEYSDEEVGVREEIFKDELLNKFNFDLESGEFLDDVNEKVAKAKMRRESNQIRSNFIKDQENFKIPERKQSDDGQVDSLVEQEISKIAKEFEKNQQEEQRVWKQTVEKDEEYSSFEKEGTIPVTLPDGSVFNYKVEDKQFIKDSIVTPESIWEAFKTKKGLNMPLLIKAMNFIKDSEGYETQIFNQGVTAGEAKYLKEKKNLSVDKDASDAPSDAVSGLKKAIRDARSGQSW